MTTAVQVRSLGDASLPSLVLVHGWGHHAGVWQPLIERLEGHFQIHLLSLPGYSESEGETDINSGEQTEQQSWQQDNILEAFNQLPIESAIWCGWSLGGMLASLYASSHPGRVSSLVTIASNAVFVQRTDWPTAMPTSDYERFSCALGDDDKATLNRFLMLVCQGSKSTRVDLRTLKGCAATASPATLQESLALLNKLDTRAAIAALAMPQLHIFGENDALVPVAVSESIALLNDDAEIEVIERAGHAPLLSHTDAIADMLKKRVVAP